MDGKLQGLKYKKFKRLMTVSKLSKKEKKIDLMQVKKTMIDLVDHTPLWGFILKKKTKNITRHNKYLIF